jgi:rhodanese-related sulfurtransferase
MLGYVAENVLSGLEETVQWNEVEQLHRDGMQLVDVRTAGEFARGSIPGSVNIPVDEIRSRLGEFQKDRVIVTCQVGMRGHTATALLNEKGIHAMNLDGGYETWVNSPSARNLQLVG